MRHMKPLFIPYKVLHNKTGKVYTVLSDYVINCTNINDGQRMVLYRDETLIFIREYNEFTDKFTPLKPKQ